MGTEISLDSKMPTGLRLDPVGIFWASFASIWSFILAGGIVFLLLNKHMAVLRRRGLPLSLCAIGFLHCYWISVQLGYVVGPKMPGDAEYWIMGIWLPIGIALFHASNARFLHVANAQRRFIGDDDHEEPTTSSYQGPIRRMFRVGKSRKLFVLISAGMVFQILGTILMYLISRKWHSPWGIPGTEVRGETEMEKKANMGKGWEWWPSVFWQVFWAWIVAPVILWQSRRIHDTQGWRLQTIACCIASLPATPMWLMALYTPQMDAVNRYFIPPQWIAISIMVIEIFTIFLPSWEVLRHQTLQRETLDSIAQWESKNPLAVASRKSIASLSIITPSIGTGWRSTDGSYNSTSNESILTMSALEHVLERNPGPLLQFSALKDFSGENIAFLTRVAEWKASLRQSTRNSTGSRSIDTGDDETLIRERFNQALKIYANFISSRDAEFQVNLPSQCLKEIEEVFEQPARSLYGERSDVNPAIPFEVTHWSNTTSEATGSDSISEKSTTASGSTLAMDCVHYHGDIPRTFNLGIFDEAEKNVKYLVLTNTWPKFVKERRSSMETIRSG